MMMTGTRHLTLYMFPLISLQLSAVLCAYITSRNLYICTHVNNAFLFSLSDDILAKPGAVQACRDVIGPTYPNKASANIITYIAMSCIFALLINSHLCDNEP